MCLHWFWWCVDISGAMASLQSYFCALFFVYTCFVHACVHIHVCIAAYMEAWGQSSVSFLRHLLSYCLNLAWRLPSWPGWLAIKSQESDCLFFPSTNMTKWTNSPGPMWVLVFELESACMEDKHFAGWSSCLLPISLSSWYCGGSSGDIYSSLCSRHTSPPHLGHIWFLFIYCSGLSVWLSPEWWWPVLFQAALPLLQLLCQAKAEAGNPKST